MNYIGGKYKLLPQIEKLFPKDINKMVDLFCGGCDVVANVVAKEVVANDINDYVIGILKEFQNMNIDELLFEIDKIIEKYKLSKTNKDGYLELRNHYNKSFEKNPLELYVLVCYSFNYQFRFNSDHEYNNPFGKDRSCFSPAMRENLIKFHKAIKNVRFTTQNFKSVNISKLGKSDFIYADPPYLITTGSYNDGKRGFEGWSKEDDQELFELLDKAHKQGVRFAMSNVLEHKGITNEELKKWASKYKIHYLNFNYNNSNYRSKNTDEKTVEVLITNY
jgi:DNA adenine methylase